MIVLVAGPPRTGSMWTYNVARALLEKAGKTIISPPRVKGDEIAAIANAVDNAESMRSDEVCCIKAHVLLAPDIPGTKIINNYRDIRDVMLSFMRFMKIDDFEEGLASALDLMAHTDHFFQVHHNNIIRIKYDHMVGAPAATVRSINGFLGLGVDEEGVNEIVSRFSRQKVEALMKELEQVAISSRGEVEGDAKGRCESLINPDGSYRALDKQTNFQTNHISSRKEGGEWREVFTAEQQERLLELTSDWLKRYGFEI